MTPRGMRLARRLGTVGVVVALAAAAIGAEALVPGPTLRLAPFAAYGPGAAAAGPMSLEVHGVEVASAIVVDGDERTTTGAFVVVDATIAVDEAVPLVARELALAGRTFTPTAKGHSSLAEGTPAPGLPVRGDVVFEVDDALLDAGLAELRVAPGLDASGDLQAQPIAVILLPTQRSASVEVEAATR